MGLAVVLMYDCILRHEEQRSLINRKMIVTETEDKQIVLLLSKTKTRENQDVSVRVRLLHELLLQRLREKDNLDRKDFTFIKDNFRKHIHKFMNEHFVLENSGSTKTPILSIILERQRIICCRGFPSMDLKKGDGGK